MKVKLLTNGKDMVISCQGVQDTISFACGFPTHYGQAVGPPLHNTAIRNIMQRNGRLGDYEETYELALFAWESQMFDETIPYCVNKAVPMPCTLPEVPELREAGRAPGEQLKQENLHFPVVAPTGVAPTGLAPGWRDAKNEYFHDDDETIRKLKEAQYENWAKR